MKRKTLWLAALLLGGLWPAHADKLVLTTGEWPPYTSEAMRGQGYVTEILEAVSHKMGRDLEVRFSSWNKAEYSVLGGLAFACYPYIESPERAKQYDFSDVVAHSTGKFFVYKGRKVPDRFEWKVLEDFRANMVGGVSGYWYDKPFKAAGLKVLYSADDAANLRNLYEGRVDVIPMDELAGWKLIEENYPAEKGNFRVLAAPLNSSPLLLMVSRTYPRARELLAQFNKALKGIKEDGTYLRILTKYNVQD